ncbi:DNA excision repair protein [Botrytis cinerea]
MARASHNEDEVSTEDEEFERRPDKVKALLADEVPSISDDEDDNESEQKPSNVDKKGKRKALEQVEWSDDDEDQNPYEKFKKRKSEKRKKLNAQKKRMKERAKDAKQAKEKGGSSKANEKVWGDDSDYEMDDEIPEYLQIRRKEFDTNLEELKSAGLQLPPDYSDIYFSDDERLADLEERPDFPSTVEPSRLYADINMELSNGVIPASIAQYLRDYQVDGVKFLHEKFVYQKGGILGDDMGLGKTVQVAAFLTAAFGKTGDERDGKRMRKVKNADETRWYPRVLIMGWWHVEKFHGDVKEKEFVLRSAQSGRVEIVITTYATYKNHKDALNTISWDCVVADECHQLKERTSLTTQAMNEINALCRIGLTGTAIQNKYEELWTLLNWCSPGKVGPLATWVSTISEPLRIGQSHDSTNQQVKRARETAKRLVNNLMPHFFLRRMKTLIAHQLPRKTDRLLPCPLTDLQREAYERFLESDVVQFVRNHGEPCDCGNGKKLTRGGCCYSKIPGTNTKWQAMVFPIMTTLQKLSNHLALLLPNDGDPREKQERDLEFLQLMLPDRWEELYKARDSIANLSNPEFCGKWKVLRKLLKHWHEEGDKVLIFSHSVKLLRMLQHLFQSTSYNVSFLSGEMKYEDRQDTVDDFNSDPNQFIFLISTKAGGVGLNITSANKVVIFDPNWNPSYDLQAQDRAYRIGQHRDVDSFRLVSAGTIEEVVYARQIYKQQQANIGYNASKERRYFKGVQNAASQKGEIFGLDNLLSFHADEILLRDIVNKTNIAETKAGVAMASFDVQAALDDDDNPLRADDDDPNGAMTAILASAGVEYTHENSEVVGSSKVEERLSRRAEETGGEIGYGEELLFGPISRQAGNGNIRYEFHPPEDVMKRQFCTMAKTFGFSSATEFAFVVEGWTQKQRTDCLERFYLKRRERLEELDKEKAEKENAERMERAREQAKAEMEGETESDNDEL